MTQEIALRTRAMQKLTELVYQHNLPLQLTLKAGSTPTHLRFLTIEYMEEDELLAEWLIAKATQENERLNASEQATVQ